MWLENVFNTKQVMSFLISVALSTLVIVGFAELSQGYYLMSVYPLLIIGLLAIGFGLFTKLVVISNGVLYGGVFIFLGSLVPIIIDGHAFIPMLIGLISLLGFAWFKFNRKETE